MYRTALSTAGFILLVYAIIEAPQHGWLSALVLGCLGGAAVLLGVFLWWERRTPESMIDLGFFRNLRFSVGSGAVSAAFFALMGGIFALTQYLQFAQGYSTIQAGAVMTPMALGLMVGGPSSSKAVARFGSSRRRGRARRACGAACADHPLVSGHERTIPGGLVLLPDARDGLGHGTRDPTPWWEPCRQQRPASPPPPTPSRAWSPERSGGRPRVADQLALLE
ncbi:MAG: hypothetical protein ACXVHK_30390 [Solirubrobacteraceae bacterium]